MLRGTVPRRDHHHHNSPQDTLLHVQRGAAVHDDVRLDVARLLSASRLGREDRFRRHRPARLLRLHVGHLREAARDFRVHSIVR